MSRSVAPPASGPSGVLQHRHQRVRQRLGVDGDRPPDELLADVTEQLRAEVVGVRVGVLEDRVHQRPERRADRQVRHRRRHAPRWSGSPDPRRSGATTSGSSCFGVSSGSLPTPPCDPLGGRGAERGVRRPSPRRVDAAGEPANGERPVVRRAGRRRELDGQRRLGCRAARGPPRGQPRHDVVLARHRDLRGTCDSPGARPNSIRCSGERARSSWPAPTRPRPANGRGSSRRTAAATTRRPPRPGRGRGGRSTGGRRRRRRCSGVPRPRRPHGTAAPPGPAGSGPTGWAGRRRGTPAPCCRGWSRAARRRRRCRGGGCARWRPRPCRRPSARAARSAGRRDPSRSSVATWCSDCPTCRRSVSSRSPSTRASTRAVSPAVTAASSTAATPRVA